MPKNASSAGGFTLVELLVVVAIVGILASVAITQFAAYKQKAVDSDMQAALHSGRQAMEAYYVADQSYIGATVQLLHDDYGYRESANVTLTLPSPPTVNRYVLCTQSTGASGTSPYFVFDSNVGVMQPSSSCP